MKVNFKTLMIAATLLAGFASCSNDDDVIGGINPIDNGKLTSFTISIGQPKTYATDPNATDEESEVNTVDVFIYDNNNIFLKRERLLAVDFTKADNKYTSTREIATTVGAKKIYVGVNMTDAMVTAATSKGLSAVNTVATANDLKTNGFVMFSKVATDANFVEAGAPTAATANKVEASVFRLLAKVVVNKGQSLSYTVTGGEVSDLQFSVSNITKLYYTLPGVNNYSPTASIADFYKEGIYKLVNVYDKPVKDANVSYALENASAQNLEGYSTYASVRAKFLPKNVVKLNTPGAGNSGLRSDVAPATPQTFYVVTNAGVKYYFLDETDAGAYDAEINGINLTKQTYTGGYCYYNVFLNPDGNYNIFRNNLYKVNIMAVNGIGKPGDDIEDPDKEVSKPTNINVVITVEDWVENIQNSEI